METDSHTDHLKKLIVAKAAREKAKADAASGSAPDDNGNNHAEQPNTEDRGAQQSTSKQTRPQEQVTEERGAPSTERNGCKDKQKNAEEEPTWSIRTRSASKHSQERSDGSERRNDDNRSG